MHANAHANAHLKATTNSPALSLSTALVLAVGSLLDIVESTNTLKNLHSLRGLLGTLSISGKNQRALRDLVNVVSTSHDKGRDSTGSQTGGDGIPLLAGVDLPVPLAPGLGGGKHAATAAHVSKGSLSRALGSSSIDTGNTGDGTASSPTCSRGLVSSLHLDTVSLAAVLGHVRVHKLDNVRAQRSSHDRREGNLSSLGAIGIPNGDKGASSRHFM